MLKGSAYYAFILTAKLMDFNNEIFYGACEVTFFDSSQLIASTLIHLSQSYYLTRAKLLLQNFFNENVPSLWSNAVHLKY